MAKTQLTAEIEIPEGIEIAIENGNIRIKGRKGEVLERLFHKKVSVAKEGKTVKLMTENPSKREKAVLGSFRAHIKNLMRGVSEGHVYKLKICSGHFPMSVGVENKMFVVKNLLGEKVPRKIRVTEGVEIKVDGDEVIVSGSEKKKVAQQAASIEELAKRTGFDKRVFQDGIYIIYKDGKEIK